MPQESTASDGKSWLIALIALAVSLFVAFQNWKITSLTEETIRPRLALEDVEADLGLFYATLSFTVTNKGQVPCTVTDLWIGYSRKADGSLLGNSMGKIRGLRIYPGDKVHQELQFTRYPEGVWESDHSDRGYDNPADYQFIVSYNLDGSYSGIYRETHQFPNLAWD